jgi:PAS domain S-box-containing protein
LELPGWNRGCGTMTKALETGRPCLCNGAQTDKRAACCRHVQDGLGVQSCGAFPLRLREEVRGAFCLTSADPDFFNAGEIRLLEKVASDVSFALDKLDEEEQRHQAEEARQRAEADLQLALEAGRLGDWSWDIVSGEIVWSARCKALYGLPPETVVTYEGFLERLHPDDRGRIEAALRQAVESQTDYAVEKRVVWPDGSLHWNTARGRVFCDDSGQPVRMAGVTLDITDRKEAEDLLRRRAEELRLRNEELTRFNRATVDRELRMIELKKLTNDLCRQLGQPPRYPLTFDAESNEPPQA